MPALSRSVVVTVAVLAGTLTPAASCATHASFERVPDAGAPMEVRQHYYQEHALERATRDDMVVRTRLFEDRPTFTRAKASMVNGARVEAIEDLVPLVPPDSDTKRAIDEALDARGTSQLLVAAGAGVIGTGVLTSGALLLVIVGVVPGQGVSAGPELLIGTGAALLVGALGGGVLTTWGMTVRDREDDAAARAYLSYDADLRRQLGLGATE